MSVLRSEIVLRRDAAAIALALLALYLLTLSGHLYSPDEEAMFYVTQGVASGTGVAVPEGDVVPMPVRAGPDGQQYSPYGVLPSLLALPFYALGALAARGGSTPLHDYTARFGVSALNAPITALTGALLYVFVRRLGFSRRAGGLAALAFGVCTFAWPYARTFFSEPLTGLLLLLATERTHAFRAHGHRSALLVAGLASGLLLPTRIAEAVALPLLILYIAASAWQRGTTIHQRGLSVLLALALFGAALLPGVMLLASYNVARFGTVLATGYADEASAFTTAWRTGLYGLLLSPGKSLFLYAPPALLGLAGAWRLWRRNASLTALLLSVTMAHVLLYARWHAWEGGGVWGPRLLLPVVPLLIVLAAPLFERPGASRWREGAQQVCIMIVLALGLTNALAGVLVNPGVYINSGVSDKRRFYVANDSPLLVHWRLLGERVSARFGSGRCALLDGFYPRDMQNAPLPRSTGPRATIVCRGNSPTLLRLSINDARLADAPPSKLALDVGGEARALSQGHSSQTWVLVPPEQPLTLRAAPWNPAAFGGQRDAPTGTLLYDLSAHDQDGTALALVDAAIEPAPASPRLRWGWYFVPYNHHLFDMWFWYLPRSEVSPRGQLALGIAIVGTSLAALGGAALVWRRSNAPLH